MTSELMNKRYFKLHLTRSVIYAPYVKSLHPGSSRCSKPQWLENMASFEK